MSGRGYYAHARGGRGGLQRREARGGRGFRKRPPTENYHQAPSKAVRLHEQSNGNWNRSPAIPGPSGSSVNVSSGGLPKPIPARREEYSPGNFQHEGLLQNSHERYSYNSAPQYHNTPPPPSPPPPANYHTIRAGGSVKDSRPFTRGSGLKHRGRSGSRGKSSRGRGTPKKISALERLGPKVPEKGQSASSSSAFANEVNRTREDSNLGIVCPHCQFKTSTWADYKRHWQRPVHLNAFKEIRLSHEQALTQLRATQRLVQNQLTRRLEQEGQRKLNLFCKMCKLVHHQSRPEHNASSEHKAIYAAIHRVCELCKVQFNARMAYEKHLGSIKHLSKVLNDDSSAGDNPDLDFNPDDFVTLDEVGDDDEGDTKEDDMEESQADDSKASVDSDKRKYEAEAVIGSERHEVGQSSKESVEKEEIVANRSKQNEDIIVKPEETDVQSEDITVKEEKEVKVEPDHFIKMDPDRPIGQEYIRQVVMYFCDLCHKYLPKVNRGDIDELIDSHCMSSVHQNSFVKKEAEKRLEEQEALKLLVKEEASQSSTIKTMAEVKREKVVFNEDQLDYEAESVNDGDVKSETMSEK